MHMDRLRLKKNVFNKKCTLKKRVFQTDIRADFLERIVQCARFSGFYCITQNPSVDKLNYLINLDFIIFFIKIMKYLPTVDSAVETVIQNEISTNLLFSNRLIKTRACISHSLAMLVYNPNTNGSPPCYQFQ